MKKVTFIIITLLFCFKGNAQKQKGREKIRAFKIAFITEKLDLTQSEAEKFWPIYNAYDKKNIELHREKRFSIKKNIKKVGGIDNLNENTAKELIGKMERLEKKRFNNKMEFRNKIKDIISYKKLLKLEITEHEFNHKLMRKLRGKQLHKKRD